MAREESDLTEIRHSPQFLTERDLAERWQVSGRTLQRRRSEGLAPTWVSIGGSIRYRLSDVLAYETRSRHGREGE